MARRKGEHVRATNKQRSRPVESQEAGFLFRRSFGLSGSRRTFAFASSSSILQGKGRAAPDFSAYVDLAIGFDGLIYVDADLSAAELLIWLPTAWQSISRRTRCVRRRVERVARSLGRRVRPSVRRGGPPDPEPWAINNHTPKLVRIRKVRPSAAQKRIWFRRDLPASVCSSVNPRFPTRTHTTTAPTRLKWRIDFAKQFLAEEESTSDEPEGVPA